MLLIECLLVIARVPGARSTWLSVGITISTHEVTLTVIVIKTALLTWPCKHKCIYIYIYIYHFGHYLVMGTSIYVDQ